MARWIGQEIENPEAYNRAKAARIQANANKTRARKLEAAIASDSEEFRCWLLGYEPERIRALYEVARAASDAAYQAAVSAHCEPSWGGSDELPEMVAYQAVLREWHRSTPRMPDFLVESRRDWGGLTDNQLAFARKLWAENESKQAARAAERARDRETAQPWTAGRQVVAGTLLSSKVAYNDFGSVMKGTLKTADGRRLYCTLPLATYAGELALERGDLLTLKVTVEVASDDPTMAFGKRPTLVSHEKAPAAA